MNDVESTASAEPTEAVQTETAVERPEWLPEKFGSAEDLASAYSSLESKLGQKEDDYRTAFMEEIEKEAYANRPETVGDYQLPEGIDESLAGDNELLQWWANHAFENGFNQEEFSEGINMYLGALNADVPDYDTELSRLGDNASARTEAVSLFANQFFPEEQLGAIERMCETADGVMALETIMEAMKDGGPTSEQMGMARMDEKQLQQMMLDDRYHNPTKRDPNFVRQVEEGFRKLYQNG